jgi:N-ethylmaleimide reductase
MSVLFEPVQIGDLQLANRVIMAPLTRSRGTGADNRVPNDLMATYYSQRANIAVKVLLAIKLKQRLVVLISLTRNLHRNLQRL